MDTNPNGTTPVQTNGNGQPGNPPATVPPQGTPTVEETLRQQLATAERERDEAKVAALAANRAVEAGRKFEKFEDFQSDVLGRLTTAEENLKEIPLLKKENEDLKKIISGNAAVTPNVNTTPTPPTNTPVVNDEEARVKGMFGLPVNKP